MADDTIITSLNFNDNIPGKVFADKKNEQDVLIGYVSGLPMRYENESVHNRGLAIALFDKGIGQNELDKRCQKLSADCRIEKIEVLVTKGDYPFDRRWYIIGDLTEMLELAKQGKMQVPISDFYYDEIIEVLDN